MKPVKQNHLDRVPTRPPCGRCGRPFANPRLSFCPVCRANFTVELHLWLERVEQENLKRLHLLKLRLALGRASRWLQGFDITAIDQAIKSAAARPGGGVGDGKGNLLDEQETGEQNNGCTH